MNIHSINDGAKMKKLFSLLRQHFLLSKRASIAIESAFFILGTVFIMAIAIDFGMYLVRQNKLDRLSQSLASVIRERSALYHLYEGDDKAELITKAQVNELHKMAKKLLNDDSVDIRVDVIYFEKRSDKEQVIASTQTIVPDSGGCQSLETPLSDFVNLSPYSNRNRWMPLYRITACQEGKSSMFKNLINYNNNEVIAGISSSSIVVPRTGALKI